MKGRVIIAGAGPGDPGLLTLKCVEALKQADVIIYDRLIPEQALDYARDNAELIYAGKEPGRHTLSQEDIIRLMIEKAKEGKTVVRLHGGDPFLFGRGFEECLAVLKEGIPCEVIPGVTSAIAAPEAFLIPLVLRGVSSSVAIVTGTEDPSKGKKFVDFKRLCNAVDTIVVLMGARRASEIANELLECGIQPDTPVAIITRAFMKGQDMTITTVEELAKGRKVENPSVIVIGNVVEWGVKALQLAMSILEKGKA